MSTDVGPEPIAEMYVSVDVEASGPVPGLYSMLSIGACVVGRADESFYAELRPVTDAFIPEALAVSGLSLDSLKESGSDPEEAMTAFGNWLKECAQGRQRPVLVGFNASFDWSFVNWYFHRFLRTNPFGIGAIDIKAYYMGLAGCAWGDTASSKLPERFRSSFPQTHNALDDARAQAEIFEKLLAESRVQPH